jgi:hypothetical protein
MRTDCVEALPTTYAEFNNVGCGGLLSADAKAAYSFTMSRIPQHLAHWQRIHATF